MAKLKIVNFSGAFLVAVCMVIAGCQSSEKTNAIAETGDGDTTAVFSDGDTTRTADSTNVNRPDPPPPAPAPGTVVVRATILSVDTSTSRARCQVRIERVLGYGSATPPISTGERTVSLFPGILQNWEIDDLLASTSQTLVLAHSGDELVQQKQGDQEDRLEWGIQSIKSSK